MKSEVRIWKHEPSLAARILGAALVVALVVGSTEARAQTPSLDRSFEIQNYIPAIGPTQYFTVESVCKACDEATRIFGAYGYSMEYDVQRYYRDNRFLLYGGGTHEVLQTTIARQFGI